MVTALSVLAVSVLVNGAGLLLGQTTGDTAAPWVQGTATLSTVGALVYIARKFATGDLVAVNTKILLDRADERERELRGLVVAQAAANDALSDVLAETNKALGRLGKR